MDIKPLTTEAVALTEKKMDMTLEDIIKMSKKPISQVRRPRVPIKNRGGFLNGGNSQVNSSLKAQRFVDSRSSMRQGVLAQKRSNFRVNQFPLAIEAARKAAQTPIRNRVVNWNKPRFVAPMLQRKAGETIYTGKMKTLPKQKPQTLDSLFADMKEQRQRTWSQQQMRWQQRGGRQKQQQQQQQQMQRGRRGAAGSGRFFNGNAIKGPMNRPSTLGY